MPKWLTPELAMKLDAECDKDSSAREIAEQFNITPNQATYYKALKSKGKKPRVKVATGGGSPVNSNGHIQKAIDALWEERNALVLKADEVEKAIESLKALQK